MMSGYIPILSQAGWNQVHLLNGKKQTMPTSNKGPSAMAPINAESLIRAVLHFKWVIETEFQNLMKGIMYHSSDHLIDTFSFLTSYMLPRAYKGVFNYQFYILMAQNNHLINSLPFNAKDKIPNDSSLCVFGSFVAAHAFTAVQNIDGCRCLSNNMGSDQSCSFQFSRVCIMALACDLQSIRFIMTHVISSKGQLVLSGMMGLIKWMKGIFH